MHAASEPFAKPPRFITFARIRKASLADWAVVALAMVLSSPLPVATVSVARAATPGDIVPHLWLLASCVLLPAAGSMLLLLVAGESPSSEAKLRWVALDVFLAGLLYGVLDIVLLRSGSAFDGPFVGIVLWARAGVAVLALRLPYGGSLDSDGGDPTTGSRAGSRGNA